MNFITDEEQWAQRLFGGASLGDKRRTARLVRYAADQARHPDGSTVVASQGNKAATEGAYRMLRNDRIDAEHINASAFAYTAEQAPAYGLMLALEDTTTLSYYHRSLRDHLGDLGGKARSKRRGFFVHSILLVDAQGPDVLGLIEQHYWVRRGRSKRGDRKRRPYRQKESFKWQRASEAMVQRLGSLMERVISICDREADVYEYLSYKRLHQERFIVRAAWDRALASEGPYARLWRYLQAQPVAAERTVSLAQKRGRKARQAQVKVRYGHIQLQPPDRAATQRDQVLEPLWVYAVLAEESAPPEGEPALQWLLLSSEPARNGEEANQVLDYYSRRSEIESFHKAWKSGCAVEERRFQEAANMQRMAVILAHIAVRLMQLQALQSVPDQPCTCLLSSIEWHCLWQSVEGRSPPEHVPTIQWAYRAVARLGGWHDSKRTGRVGWPAMWRGWMRLQDRVEGWLLATQYRE